MRSIHKKQINVPGIIGGMGPFSHLRFEQLLLDKSRKIGATIDSMYPVYILVSATDIPDRSEALAKADQRIVDYLVNYGKILRNAGADFLVVTCNTAHVFYEEVFPQLDIPWINMIDEVVQNLLLSPLPSCIGLVCTDGSIQCDLYLSKLSNISPKVIQPELNSEIQNRIMNTIYNPEWGVKSNGFYISQQAKKECEFIIQWLVDREVELVIAGCTEISILFSAIETLPIKCVDPIEVLAEKTLSLAFELSQISYLDKINQSCSPNDYSHISRYHVT